MTSLNTSGCPFAEINEAPSCSFTETPDLAQNVLEMSCEELIEADTKEYFRSMFQSESVILKQLLEQWLVNRDSKEVTKKMISNLLIPAPENKDVIIPYFLELYSSNKVWISERERFFFIDELPIAKKRILKELLWKYIKS